MIEGILAEWYAKQPKEMQKAWDTNGVVYASIETMRCQMSHLYSALREEGVHIFHARRVINRMLYGTPEPDGVSTLFDQMRNMRLQGLDDSTLTLTGQLDPKAVGELIKEFTKAGMVIEGGDYSEESLQVQQD